MPRPKKERPNHAGELYEVKITTGKTFDGKLIRKSFYSNISKADAKAKADEYKINQAVAEQTGTVFVSKDFTFQEWAIKWLETYKKPHTSDNTYRLTYENTVNKHLLPYFGTHLLKEIKSVDVQAFFATKQDLSMSMLEKMKLCLTGIFETAIDNDLCIKNPAKSASYTSKAEPNIKKVYSNEEIETVIEFAKTRIPEISIILHSGLRRGEVLGLKWEDIDLKNHTLSVNRSIADKEGGGTEIRPPKWNSYRTIPIELEAVKILKSIQKNGEYVFSSEIGCVQSPNTFSQKVDRFMSTLKGQYPTIEKLTPHELRHTFGTKLRRDGVDIYKIGDDILCFYK